MGIDLALIWAMIILFGVMMYVVMDGFDLGVGILFPFVSDAVDRDVMVNTVAPVWDGNVVRAVDLDLDVVKTIDERGTYVDDEDEFAEHQRLFGYPPDVIELAERSCAWVHDAVVRELPPFDGTADRWLALVAAG